MGRPRFIITAGLIAASLVLSHRNARADDPNDPLPKPRAATQELPAPNRLAGDKPLAEHTEYAGAPILGGNTDIGFQIGLAAIISRVSPRFVPYRWKLEGLVSASIKDGPRGTEVVQQSHNMRIDVPRSVSGKVRIMPGIFFERTVNAGYFGQGNAAPVIANPDGSVGNRYQYTHREIRARVNLRSPLSGPFSLMYGLSLRNVTPSAYPQSKLDIDSQKRERDGSPVVHGLRPLNHAMVAGGLVYDTRDNEITPHKGSLDEFALRLGGAVPTDASVYYGGLNVTLRRYLPLGGPFTLATRLLVDAMAGHVAYYDLSQGGAFIPYDIPGGERGVRGVPNGRYQGLLKVITNVELRFSHVKFRAFGDDFRLGNTAFFDAGRVFTRYGPDERDGTGLGLKYGVGGGIFVVWGTAAVFRVDVAYSPDAVAANPNFPIGIYAADGVMF